MHHCIFAYTACTHPYPTYVSLNVQPDGRVTLDVRGSASEDGQCGPTARIELPRSELIEMTCAMTAFVANKA